MDEESSQLASFFFVGFVVKQIIILFSFVVVFLSNYKCFSRIMLCLFKGFVDFFFLI